MRKHNFVAYFAKEVPESFYDWAKDKTRKVIVVYFAKTAKQEYNYGYKAIRRIMRTRAKLLLESVVTLFYKQEFIYWIGSHNVKVFFIDYPDRLTITTEFTLPDNIIDLIGSKVGYKTPEFLKFKSIFREWPK